MSEEKYTAKYLKNTDLKVFDDNFKLSDVEIVSNDTIDEEKLKDRIIKSGKKNELLAATLQLAISGYGNKQFREYKYKGEIRSIDKLFRDVGVKTSEGINSKLDTGDLTPRRLLRIFRFQIKKYLEMNNVASYLFIKYGNNEFRTTTFPGAEFLVEENNEVENLIECYKKLDNDLKEKGKQSGLLERLKRILIARGKKVNWEEIVVATQDKITKK